MGTHRGRKHKRLHLVNRKEASWFELWVVGNSNPRLGRMCRISQRPGNTREEGHVRTQGTG